MTEGPDTLFVGSFSHFDRTLRDLGGVGEAPRNEVARQRRLPPPPPFTCGHAGQLLSKLAGVSRPRLVPVSFGRYWRFAGVHPWPVGFAVRVIRWCMNEDDRTRASRDLSTEPTTTLPAEIRYAFTMMGLHLDDVRSRRTRVSVDVAHRGLELL
jgi:hypothetical protein